MEVVNEIVIKRSFDRNIERDEGVTFRRIEDAAFCKGCGKEYKVNELNGSCPSCKGGNFLKGDFAGSLAGYLKLDKESLQKLSRTRLKVKDSIIKMNSKRIIIWMLVQDGFFTPGDRKTEDIVRIIIRSKEKR